MFGGFLDDPLFSMHREHMRQMQEMMSFPFGSMMRGPFGGALALTDGRGLDSNRQGDYNRGRNHRSDALVPQGMFDPFANVFGMVNNFQQMIPNLQTQLEQMENGPDNHFYSQSCVMSYSNTGSGQPQVYQATSATRQLPGGVKETHRSVRDSATGVEKMSIGRHIGDRGQVITRERNVNTGDQEENKDLVNLDEEEEGNFNTEFRSRTGHYSGGGQPIRRHQPAIASTPYSRSGPIIEDVTDAPEYKSPKKHSRRSRRH